MKKNEIVDTLRSVRLTGGCREDATDLKLALGDRWAWVRHDLRQIALGLADDKTVHAIEMVFEL
jgi:23S rRNA C2498 (ribose-2'-O)-methylase RlmM